MYFQSLKPFRTNFNSLPLAKLLSAFQYIFTSVPIGESKFIPNLIPLRYGLVTIFIIGITDLVILQVVLKSILKFIFHKAHV